MDQPTEPNPAEAKTIGRVIREMPELSSFLQLLEKTGIGSLLFQRIPELATPSLHQLTQPSKNFRRVQ